MATTEQIVVAESDAALRATGMIPVENPATGEIIGHVPAMTAANVAECARRGRDAQPAWQALGYDGRGRVFRRMQRWIVTTPIG